MHLSSNKLIGLYHQYKSGLKWSFSKDKEIVSKNIRFRNVQNKTRCFILGNGPSINNYDLSLIKNEYVFCVNEFVRHDSIEIVFPDCYVIADPKFFELNKNIEEDNRFIEKINNLGNINADIQMFVPLEAKKIIEAYNWNENFDINYFKSGIYFDSDYNKKIHLDKRIPSMQAVVQYSVLIAIYMGFREIYLLGTEQTNIFGNLKAYMSVNDISEYSFSMTEKERLWKNKKLTEYSLPETLRGYARIFEIYDQLYLYCQRNGIKIFNCAQETMIQNIPKVSFEELF